MPDQPPIQYATRDEYEAMKADLLKYGLGPGESMKELEREDRAFLLYQTNKYEGAHDLAPTAPKQLVDSEVAWWRS